MSVQHPESPPPSTPATPRLLSVADVARETAVSVRTIRELISHGRIRSVRIGRCIRVPRDVVEFMIREGA
jgi:excisionase family DNA binding protein